MYIPARGVCLRLCAVSDSQSPSPRTILFCRRLTSAAPFLFCFFVASLPARCALSFLQLVCQNVPDGPRRVESSGGLEAIDDVHYSGQVCVCVSRLAFARMRARSKSPGYNAVLPCFLVFFSGPSLPLLFYLSGILSGT